jgi:hypothetical protein
MVLSSKNSGKYLSGEYAREREQCARNKDQYTAEQQAFYGITGSMGHGDRDEETFKVDSIPVDPLTPKKKNVIDIRTLPQMGGRL